MTRRQSGRKLACAIALCAASAAFCVAQQPTGDAAVPPEEPLATLRVTSRTVEIAAVVRNKAGEPQEALTKDDFTLKVDGKEQPIQHFAMANDLPLTLALLVDVSGSQRTFISDEWRASDIFFQTMLTRPQDRATLVQIDARVMTLAAMTNSVQRLHLALTQLGESASASQATLLNEAVYLVVRDKLAREQGRRAIVLLTDGGDNGSRITLNKAVEQAQRANVPVYAIDYSAWTDSAFMNGSAAQKLRDAGEALLKDFAERTGGRVYTVAHGMTLQRIYSQIASDLRMEYELAYNPPAGLTPNSFHKLELRVKDKQFKVQARNGFFVQP